MNLEEWQDRLLSHFHTLKSQRLKDAPGQPIFGLEHGLTEDEIKEITVGLHNQLKYAAPSITHWLLWVVYATEFGYLYSGDEFWQTFDDNTPRWDNNYRHSIRRYFSKFHKDFNGPKPNGVWADHFSIICWPITNAILPRDLQKQLVKILYDIRHTYRSEYFESPSLLGQKITLESYRSTSRFQKFSEQSLLVGQISAALLVEKDKYASSLILQSALDRIISDLNKEAQSKEWLRQAQSTVSRIKIRGLQLHCSNRDAIAKDGTYKNDNDNLLDLFPSLVIIPSNENNYNVYCEIPDLNPLYGYNQSVATPLVKSRCIFPASSKKNPLARGYFLYGKQNIQLQRWPQSGEKLLRFEEADKDFEDLISIWFTFPDQERFLFKINSDGIGREIRTGVVRAGNKYILVSRTEFLAFPMLSSKIILKCDDAFAILLDLPESIEEGHLKELESLSLSCQREFEIRPIGVPPAFWDGEGKGDWLFGAPVLFCCSYIHPLAGLRFILDGDAEKACEIPNIAAGSNTNICLNDLPVGLHRLEIVILASATSLWQRLGLISIVVREARPWIGISQQQYPVRVLVDPIDPSMEDLWEGRARIGIEGPLGWNIKELFTFYGMAGTITKHLPPFQLPVTVEAWRSHFHKHLQEDQHIQTSYDLSSRCQIQFDFGELGTYTLACDRDVRSLRWAFKHRKNKNWLVLINDSGIEEIPMVLYFPFENPSIGQVLERDSSKGWFQASENGGLYYANSANLSCSIIAPPSIKLNLCNLAINPEIEKDFKNVEEYLESIATLGKWEMANISGNIISLTRRRQIVRAMNNNLIRNIVGSKWINYECLRLEEKMSDKDLLSCVSANPEFTGFKIRLGSIARVLQTASNTTRIDRIAQITKLYLWRNEDEGDVRWIVEYALRLCSNPGSLNKWAANKHKDGLNKLIRRPDFVKGIRYFTTEINLNNSNSNLDELDEMGNWRWD